MRLGQGGRRGSYPSGALLAVGFDYAELRRAFVEQAAGVGARVAALDNLSVPTRLPVDPVRFSSGTFRVPSMRCGGGAPLLPATG